MSRAAGRCVACAATPAAVRPRPDRLPHRRSRCTPAAASRAAPPAAVGFGSATAYTTVAMPASSSASTHGGVLPWWLQGSRVTTAVPPSARPSCPAQRHHLGVRPARRLGAAGAGDPAVAVQNDRAHRRIRIGAAFDQVGVLDGESHGGVVADGRRGAHRAADAVTRRRPVAAVPRPPPPGLRRRRPQIQRRSSRLRPRRPARWCRR